MIVVKKILKLIVKNILLRTMIFLGLIMIANCAFLIRNQDIDSTFVLTFNLISISIFLVINIIDLTLMRVLKNSSSPFAKWFFINKFFSWQTSFNGKYLAITKQNKFLAINKKFLSVPLWSPYIEIPTGVLIVYIPFFIFSITSLLTTNFSLVSSLVFFTIIMGFTLVIANLWFKNCNDSYKKYSRTYNLIQKQINKVSVDDYNHALIHETWINGVLKITIMLFASLLLTFSLFCFAIATKTIFTKPSESIDKYPYFDNWALFIFYVHAWKNAFFITLLGILSLLWFVNICVFIHTPWYLLIIWKKTYLTFNIATLNFIIISFWSIRFDDEKKVIGPLQKAEKLNEEKLTKETDSLATTSSIIEQKNEIIQNNESDEIITRIIPLDMVDENK